MILRLCIIYIIFYVIVTENINRRYLKRAEKMDIIVASPLPQTPQILTEDFTWGCIDDFIMNDVNVCSREIISDPRIGCTNGYQLSMQSGLCQGTESLDVLQVCPPGFLPNGKLECEKIDVVDKIYLCPEGYHIGVKSCEKKVIGYAIDDSLCPTGFDKDQNGKCTGTLYERTIVQCPENYTETKDGKCERLLLTVPTPICLPGYDLKYGNTICEKMNITQVSVICSSGSSLNKDTNKCTRTEYSESIALCRDGWKFDGLQQKCTCPQGQCQPQILQQALPEPVYMEKPPLVQKTYGQGVSNYAVAVADVNNVDVVTITLPSINPRTVYYPQYVVHGVQDVTPTVLQNVPCDKKKKKC